MSSAVCWCLERETKLEDKLTIKTIAIFKSEKSHCQILLLTFVWGKRITLISPLFATLLKYSGHTIQIMQSQSHLMSDCISRLRAINISEDVLNGLIANEIVDEEGLADLIEWKPQDIARYVYLLVNTYILLYSILYRCIGI
jgi:hypothetical protein